MTMTQSISDLTHLISTLALRHAVLERRGDRIKLTPKTAIRGLEAVIAERKPELLELLDLAGGRLGAEELSDLTSLAKDYGLTTVLQSLARELCFRKDRESIAANAAIAANAVQDTKSVAAIVSVVDSPSPQTPQLITRPSDLEALLPHLLSQPCLGFDLETTGLDPHQDRVRLVSVAWPEGVALVDAFAVPLQTLAPLLGLEGPTLIGHNLKFDLTFLLQAGVWAGPGTRLWDTALAEQVLEASARMPSLADLSERYTGQTLDKALQASDWTGRLSREQLTYAALDAVTALRIQALQAPKVLAAELDRVLLIEHRALPAVTWMETSGVPFDLERWAKAALGTSRAADRLLDELPFGVNWNSPSQVLRYLRSEGLSLEDTSEASLSRYREHPLVAKLLEYREVAKRSGTYGPEWAKYLHPITGRIHPSWRQIGAETGRFSCSRPNLQQVPRLPELRAAFRPPEGRALIKADYSQIELRIAAVIANEHRMLEAYRQGQDLHSLTASRVLGKAPSEVTKHDRQLAKALNFGLVYGMGAESLRNYARTNYGLALTASEAVNLREAFFAAYPGLRRWHRSQPQGETEVRTLTGRRRVTDRYTEKLNTPVQGTGADGLKLAMALLWERRERLQGAVPVLAVHDEIVLEAPRDVTEGVALELVCCMKEAMQEVLNDRVPVEVEAGVYEDWGVTASNSIGD